MSSLENEETLTSYATKRRTKKAMSPREANVALDPFRNKPKKRRRRSLSSEDMAKALSSHVAKQKRQNDAERIRRVRRDLPIYPFRGEIVDAIDRSSAVVVVGATGSGKSTQIPQYLLDVSPSRRKKSSSVIVGHGQCVAITQPRRVAAMTVAKRVAKERGCTLGSEVGYAVRFDDCSGPDTRVRYMTDGLLLREAMVNRTLGRYRVIVLDEAHERSLHTDILLGFLKGLLRRRSNLRLVIMSATLNADAFSQFFNDAPVLRIAGRMHPVRMMYTAEPQADYVDAIITSVLQIHVDEKEGDILAFLTGQEEIESVASVLRQRMEEIMKDCAPHLRPAQLLVCPIFAALPHAEQMRVFAETPPNHRKVVLATNIAESSVTIPGIRYVVDAGFSKQRAYRAKTGVECLLVTPISQEQAWQRSGRAGREAPGVCYRLYTEDAFETKLRPVAIPEIQRCNLCTVILQLKASGIDDITSFDFIEPPRPGAVLRALQQLLALGALRERDGALTSTGKQMASLPLSAEYAKLLIQSGQSRFDCVSKALTLVAMLSVDSVLFFPKDKREAATNAHRRFSVHDSDHETLLNVYDAFHDANQSLEWCRKHFVNFRSMRLATRIRAQLEEIREKALRNATGNGVEEKEDAATKTKDTDEYEATMRLRQCLAASCFLSSARVQPGATKGAHRSYRTLVTSQTVSIHPSSVLFRRAPRCVIYNELVLTARQYMRCVTAIPVEWLLEYAPGSFEKTHRDPKAANKTPRV